MHKWLIRLLAVGAIVGAIVVLRLTVFAPQPLEVQVVAVERGTVEETVTNSKAGTVRARQRAQLSPEVGGRVAALQRRKGDTVRAGEAILRLDDSTQRAQLAAAQRDLQAARDRHTQACLEADRAARELARYQDPKLRQYVSDNFIDQLAVAAEAARVGCNAAFAAVLASQANMDIIQSQIEKTVLRAPFDGLIADLAVEVGEFITPSPPGVPIPAVVDLINPNSIYISAPMNEVDSARIRPGQEVRVTLDPYPGQKYTGRVVRVAPYVLDILEQNRTVEIEVELDDDAFARRLLPGTSADVEVVLNARPNTLRLPTTTLIEGSKTLLVEHGRLVERPVEVGIRNWEYAEIVSGLAEGDRVVSTLDRAQIKAGARVSVVEATTPR